MTTLSGRTKLPKLFKLVDGTDIPSTIIRSAAPIYIDGLPTGEGGAATWDSITGKPATFAPTIGTTATTAKAGNYVPAWGDITGKPTTFAPAAHAATLVNVAADATNGITAGNAQVVISALAARVKALEDAAA